MKPLLVSALLIPLSWSALGAQGQAPRYINPPGLSKPTSYTHVVVAPDGRTVYLAGQVALDSSGQLVGRGDHYRQADQVLQNLGRALESVGGSLNDLVKTTVYLTDLKGLPALREARAKHFGSRPPPASTLVVVSSLARPEFLVEIDGIALLRQTVRPAGGE